MKQIDKNNKIFNSKEFQKDKYKFDLIYKILENDNALLISDEENYIIARGDVKYPSWIWTKDKISQEKVQELEEVLKLYLRENKKDKFVCKKELYEQFLNDDLKILNKEDYFEMGTLICNKVNKPKITDGKIDRVKKEELDIISKFWYLSTHEMNNVAPLTIEQAKKDAKQMIESDNFYIWRNKEGKIVCMAIYVVNNGQAKVSHVYTDEEERGKGYSANLIYEITKKILEDGLIPLLYTDYNYYYSNKSYKNAGYEDTGILINFTCSKNKLKERKK